MTLTVEPAALTGYARQLGRAAEDAVRIRSYVDGHAEAGTGGELFAIAREGHQHAVGVINASLRRLAALLERSEPEVVGAASHYLHTDAAAAAAMDRVMSASPGQCQTALEREFAAVVCRPAAFADIRRVADRLVLPPDPQAPSNALGWMDYLSPTSWALKGFDLVLGFDPLAWLQERMFGDWAALATMEAVFSNARLAVHDLALNVQSGATTLHSTWHGNAGDAAYRYFTDVATAITSWEAPLQEIGRAYRVMADAVWSICEALGGVVKALIDAAIIAGIAAAGGTLASFTGVGAIVGYGVAAVEVANILRLWGEATRLYQSASSAVLAFRAVLGHNLSNLEAVTLPTMPGGAGYDHPLVPTRAPA
jgi:hypothetical protein